MSSKWEIPVNYKLKGEEDENKIIPCCDDPALGACVFSVGSCWNGSRKAQTRTSDHDCSLLSCYLYRVQYTYTLRYRMALF